MLLARSREDRCFQIAGSLAFTSLLALVPLITIGLTAVSAFPAFQTLAGPIRGFILNHLVPASSGKLVTVYTDQFVANAARLTAVGLAGLTLSAILMMMTLDSAFDRIWRVRQSRPLLNRLLIHWTVLTVGPLLIGASLSLTSWLVSLSLGPGLRPAQGHLLLLKVVPALLTCMALAFLYWAVPNRPVRAADALLGGVVAGVGFEIMKVGLGAYVLMVPTYKIIYGAFASIPVFLVWVYLSWLVVVFGAELTAGLPYLRLGLGRRRTPAGEEFLLALRILWQLAEAHRAGRTLSPVDLAQALQLGWEELEILLEALEAQGWVARTALGAALLARAPDAITLAEVFRRFSIDPAALGPEGVPGLALALGRLDRGLEAELSVSLAALWAEAGTANDGPA